jgi:hypothetical protein
MKHTATKTKNSPKTNTKQGKEKEKPDTTKKSDASSMNEKRK